MSEARRDRYSPVGRNSGISLRHHDGRESTEAGRRAAGGLQRKRRGVLAESRGLPQTEEPRGGGREGGGANDHDGRSRETSDRADHVQQCGLPAKVPGGACLIRITSLWIKVWRPLALGQSSSFLFTF